MYKQCIRCMYNLEKSQKYVCVWEGLHSQVWRFLALSEVLLDSHHTVTQSSSSRKLRSFCQRGERTFTILEPCSITRTSSSSSRPVDRPHTHTHTETLRAEKKNCQINLKSYKNLLQFPIFSTSSFG